MRDVNKIQNYFYFNNKSSLDFEIVIAGQNDINTIVDSLFPVRTMEYEKALKSNKSYLTSITYNPRIINIPVVIKNIKRINEIIAWLTTSTPCKMYFYDESEYVMALFDNSSNTSIQVMGYCDSKLGVQVDLKFICPCPFIYRNLDITFKKFQRINNAEEINPLIYLINPYEEIVASELKSPTQKFFYENSYIDTKDLYREDSCIIFYMDATKIKNTEKTIHYEGVESNIFYNSSNIENDSIIKFTTTQTTNIVAGLNGENISCDSVDETVNIDMERCVVVKNIKSNIPENNRLANYKGDFYSLLPQSYNSISVTSGNVEQIDVQMNLKYL